jgi:hypothetical protein
MRTPGTHLLRIGAGVGSPPASARSGPGRAGGPVEVQAMLSRLDPLIGRAARWLDVLGARRRAGGAPAAGTEALTREVTASVADRLQSEVLTQYAWLDVGVWGRPVFRSAAEAAHRLCAVSLAGDELS